MKKTRDFLSEGVWADGNNEKPASRKRRWLVRQARLVLYTARGVQQHNTVIRSAALTFFTLMSLVPVLALAFGIIKGFGLQGALESALYERFSDNAAIIGYVLSFVNQVIERTSGGIVAVSGLAVLIWAAARVFGNVENAFNIIWEVRKPRSITRRASTYAAVIFVMPLLVVLLMILLSYVRSLIANYSAIPYSILYAIGSFVMLWLLFTVAYKAIPNTHVRFRFAASAGVVAAVAFSVFQLVYVSLQDGVSSYNIIYGSFAAIPLFLLWVQSSWQILLFGAELSFAFQNVDSYVQEQDAKNISIASRNRVMVGVMLSVLRSYANGSGGISSDEVAHELKLSVRLVRDVMRTLDDAGLVVPITSDRSQKTNVYVPARDMHCMRVGDVLSIVARRGTVPEAIGSTRCLRYVSALADRAESMVYDSDVNLLLTDLLNDDEDCNNRKR